MFLSQRDINSRIVVIQYFLILFLFLLASRLAYIQIYKHSELKEIAEKQQRREISLAKKRGLITDRNGSVLAIDTQSISLYAYPKEYKLEKFPVELMAQKIAPILGEKEETLKKNLSSKSFIWLRRQMDVSKERQIKELKIPGINYVYESKRMYPKKSLGASLLGFTGIDNQGLTGIEGSFDDVLTSKNDQEKIFLDARGHEVISQENKEQVTTSKAKTNTVKLTLDEKIQYVSERELEKGMKEYKADRGLVIVMDLENGDLLGLATNPSYDPNNYSKTNWNVIKNWAVTDFYEPGSTMKIFSIAAALERGKIGINEYVSCPGAIKVDGWIVHDHGMGAGQVRQLQPEDILKVSSNVGTSLVARRMSPSEHRGMLLKFGFGKITDSALTGEVRGIVPELPWVQSRQSTISFGQGVAVTPIQIVTAMSSIARSGIRIEPRIIKDIIGVNDQVIKKYESKQFRTLSTKVADQLRSLLTSVVQDKEGTGKATKIPGYVIAGKTGTADKVEKGRYRGSVVSSFLGFYPAENPKVLQFVLFDNPKTAHSASMTAVPVFREIANNVLKILKIPPTRPEELLKEEKSTK
jgi:cell division protein FtsI/penicillin-binding protein 2